MPNEHALLSASSSQRWISCNPSARLEQEFSERTESEAAREGTIAHEFAELKLKAKLGMIDKKDIPICEDEEMDLYTEDYADYVFEQYKKAKKHDKNAIILIEQRLDFSCYVPDGFGTVDALIISKGKLQIYDFKYGKGITVIAINNSQMKLYALGALRKYGKEYEIKKVKLTIIQPRRFNISSWDTTPYQLKRWANGTLRKAADNAYKGTGEYQPGEHCQFCKAKYRCRARAEANLKQAQQELKLPPLYSDAEIEAVLPNIPAIKKWCEELWEYAIEEAKNGKEWNGMKLVEGKSTRKYIDETQVVDACKSAGYTNIYESKLLTITKMEKLMGKKQFENILGKLVEKKPGNPTLVCEDDSRQTIRYAKNEFKGDI